MTAQARRTSADTVRAMQNTAEELEAAESVLHRSAEASPNENTTERLHRIGDAVTAEAKAIARRAERIADRSAE